MNWADRNCKVIIDTNIWVSFLIGKRLQCLLYLILEEHIIICTCIEQIKELKATFQKPKLKEYFNILRVTDFFEFLTEYAQIIPIVTATDICRDKKDNYLVSLAINSDAKYLIIGDNDLLVLSQINKTQIIKYSVFEQMITNM